MVLTYLELEARPSIDLEFRERNKVQILRMRERVCVKVVMYSIYSLLLYQKDR